MTVVSAAGRPMRPAGGVAATVERVQVETEETLSGVLASLGDELSVQERAEWKQWVLDHQRLHRVPMCDRLRGALHVWQQELQHVTTSEAVINTIRFGMNWRWSATPPMTRVVAIPAPPISEIERIALEKAIDTAVLEGVYRLVPAVRRSDGRLRLPHRMFVSRLFTVPKSSGGHRLIHSLAQLNQYVTPVTFRMSSIRDAVVATSPGRTLFARLDLSQSFFNLPVADALQHYLGAVDHRGRVYECMQAPMGLSVSPRALTQVLAPVMARLSTVSGCKAVIPYCDDALLVFDCDEATARRGVLAAVRLLTDLGLELSVAKCALRPSTQVSFLGFVLDASAAEVSVPSTKWQSCRAAVRRMSSRLRACKAVQPREVASLIGQLRALRPAVEQAFVHTTRLCAWLKQISRRVYSHTELLKSRSWIGLPSTPMPPPADSEALLTELARWIALPASWRRTPMLRMLESRVVLRMWTDASTSVGWGAAATVQWPQLVEAEQPVPKKIQALGELRVSGVWSPNERALHINTLESRAIRLAMEAAISWWWRTLWHTPALQAYFGPVRCAAFRAALSRSTICVFTDSRVAMTVFGAVRPRSQELADEVAGLDLLLRDHPVAPARVLYRHIAGQDNGLADRLSRMEFQSLDWEVTRLAYDRLCRYVGVVPKTDLMATRATSKCKHYVSFDPDPAATQTDVFSVNLDEMAGPLYVCPGVNTRVIERLLQRLQLFQPTLRTPVMLILPEWRTARWRSRLRVLLDGAGKVVAQTGLPVEQICRWTAASPAPEWIRHTTLACYVLWPRRSSTSSLFQATRRSSVRFA